MLKSQISNPAPIPTKTNPPTRWRQFNRPIQNPFHRPRRQGLPTQILPHSSCRRSAITDFSGAAVGGSAFSTEVYFQIRRQFELDEPSEVVIERVTDGRLISSRDALEQFVRENPELQDGSGYEIWLVTETGGQKVERPIVEFEITGGKPGPAAEEVTETPEPPRLKDVPFEQPVEQGVRIEE